MIWQITSGVNVAGAPQRGASAQASRHGGGGIRVPPPSPPVTGGFAPNPKLLSRLLDAEAGCRQQNDPGSLSQFLWR
jgi:hypothetical protein